MCYMMNALVDPNLDTEAERLSSSTIACYSNDMCTEGENDIGTIASNNNCCGFQVFAPYYRINDGQCSPCKSIVQYNYNAYTYI